MTPRSLLFPAILVCLSAFDAVGQCSAITIGPDQVICQGQSANFTLPGGYPNYLWSNGATTQGTSFSTSGPVWGQASYPTGNIVTNGDFSGGNTGFTSTFTYTTNLSPDATYYVGGNAGTYHPFFVGWGSWLFLICNGGTAQSGWNVWEQTVNICPGQTYSLAFQCASMVSQNPPQLQWEINGAPYGPVFTPPAGPNVWVTFNTTWTAPLGPTTANIAIQLNSSYSIGNDFGIDNINMSGNMAFTDNALVTVNPLPNAGPDNSTSICAGGTVDLTTLLGSTAMSGGSWSAGPVVSAAGTYTYSVSNSCGSDQSSFNVNVIPIPSAGADATTTICAGSTVNLNTLLSGADPGGTWSGGPVVGSAGLYTYTVGNGCGSDVASFTVNVTSLPTAGADASATICSGSTIDLNTLLSGADPGGTWSSGPVVGSAGVYTYAVNTSCGSDQASFTIGITPIPQPDLGEDLVLCDGDSVILSVNAGMADVLWSTGDTVQSITVNSAASYSVSLTLDGCMTSDEIGVSFVPWTTTVDLGPDRTICPGEPVLLDTHLPYADHLWSDGSTGSTLMVETAGLITVEVNGTCLAAVDTIRVIEGDCPPLVHVPNAFTPDGDGMNEVFQPWIVGDVEEYELSVFDRWGEAIHTTSNTTGWNGEVNGTPAPVGVYVWVIRYKSLTDAGVKQERLTGHVTLLR